MDSKYIKVDQKNQQIKKKDKNITPIQGFCMFLTKALSPVPPDFAMTPHIC